MVDLEVQGGREMNDIEIALEDLDTLVEIARQHTGIASWHPLPEPYKEVETID